MEGVKTRGNRYLNWAALSGADHGQSPSGISVSMPDIALIPVTKASPQKLCWSKWTKEIRLLGSHLKKPRSGQSIRQTDAGGIRCLPDYCLAKVKCPSCHKDPLVNYSSTDNTKNILKNYFILLRLKIIFSKERQGWILNVDFFFCTSSTEVCRSNCSHVTFSSHDSKAIPQNNFALFFDGSHAHLRIIKTLQIHSKWQITKKTSPHI